MGDLDPGLGTHAATTYEEVTRAPRMPQVPTDMFINGVMEAIRRNREFVPPYGVSDGLDNHHELTLDFRRRM